MVGRPAGVKEVPVAIKATHIREGRIQSLELVDGQLIEGDLFVDCSGFAKVLVDQLPFEFEPAGDHYNDTSYVGPYQYVSPSEVSNVTTMAAMDWGWRFSVPMVNRSGEGYQFSSKFVNDPDRLVDEYVEKTGKPGNILRKISWTPGMYKNAFVGNTIALGLSAGFVDVFDANNFSSVMMFIKRMVEHLQKDPQLTLDWQRDYNWYVNEINKDIMFRIDIAFQLAPKNKTEYWQALKAVAVEKHTQEKYYEAMWSSRKRNNLGFQNNAYTQHIFLNTDLYYKMPLNIPEFDIDTTTMELAKSYFEYVNTKNRIQSSMVEPIEKYYERLHKDMPIPCQTWDPNIQTSSDFLG
jgi:hypothetical protein